jgi:hypothetical protein
MRLVYELFAILFLLQIIACKNTVKEPSPDIIYDIDVDNTQDLIDIKLSDLADSFSLIPLETTKECLLDNYTEYYVDENYILAYSENGVYKFSEDGKFVKKLFGKGRGPDEFFGLVGFCIFVVDKKNNLLYISDQLRRQEFLVYDIKAEHFLEPVKKCFPGSGSFAIYDDSLIIGSTFNTYDTSNYAVYVQNFKGELVTRINHKKKILYNQLVTSQPSWLTISDTSYHISYSRDDTLFEFKDNRLFPYLVLNFNLPRENPPNRSKKKGDRIISFPSVEAPSFIIIKIGNIDEIVWYSTSAGDEKIKNSYFLFNKFTGKAAKIRTYTDNFIGNIQDVFKLSQTADAYMKFPSTLPNGKIVIAYTPDQITKAIENGLNYNDFQDTINKQLLKINENMKETDNPVLLVGMIKKRL